VLAKGELYFSNIAVIVNLDTGQALDLFGCKTTVFDGGDIARLCQFSSFGYGQI
jgi:hypothetical protein